MAFVREAVFTVSWTSAYPDVLAAADGALVTRSRYAAVLDAPGADLGLPWAQAQDGPSWSRFWSSYLGRPGALRQLGADAAWEHVVPLQVWHSSALAGPDGATGRTRVLLYPAAVSVIITVRVSGAWQVGELAAALAGLRTAEQWQVAGATGGDRTLRGIAGELLGQVAGRLFQQPPAQIEHGLSVQRTVAAPIAADGGPPEAFALTDPTVRSCLAGLASLGPPGEFAEARLLGSNSDTNLGGRCYVLSNGHAVWHPAHLVQRPPRDPLGCLVRNQTDLVAHIEAVGSMVTWAAERLAAGDQIPVPVQPLLRVAAERLRILHAGNSRSTYRSGLAMARLAPLLESIELVRARL